MAITGTGSEVIAVGLISAISAQLIKMLSHFAFYKKPNFRLMVETGGMPSSHSSAMSAMATSVGLVSGFQSVDFAIALGVALIVMYDAAGVRQAAGRMAGILNRMAEDVYAHLPERLPNRLRELLGHTPFEVCIGALYGIGLAIILHDYFAQMH